MASVGCRKFWKFRNFENICTRCVGIEPIALISKRSYNRKSFRLTKIEKQKREREAKKYQNSISEDSNYFEKPDVTVLQIPRAMKPDSNIEKLNLSDNDWLYWQSVESKIDFETIYDKTKQDVLKVVKKCQRKINRKMQNTSTNNNDTSNNSSNDTSNDDTSENDTATARIMNDVPLRFNDPLHKATILGRICKELEVNIPSSQLRSIQSVQDIIDWICCNERKKMVKKWHRQRYMPHNLPNNLTVELPWFYCLGNEGSPWRRSMGK